MSGGVYVRSLDGYRDGAALLQAVEGFFAFLPPAKRPAPGMRVVLKPNLMSKHPPARAVTTHPEVLRAVILALQGLGVTDITVADSPGGLYTPAVMRSIYEGCGLAAVCRETGAAMYTACEEGQRPSAGVLAKEPFTLIKPVLECDLLINLPKMKTHVLTGISGAVKNLFGCVPGLRKPEYHMRWPGKRDFADLIVDVCETVKADLHIMDGIVAMEGDGPGSGEPRACGLLLAGRDPYAIDLAVCRVMGVEPMNIPLVAAARTRGLCAEALDTALLHGDAGAVAPVPGYAQPASYSGRVDVFGRLPGFLKPLMPAVSALLAPRPAVKKARCVGCGKCAEICPARVIGMRGKKARIHGKLEGRACIRCFCCHEVCPVKAIQLRQMPLFRL